MDRLSQCQDSEVRRGPGVGAGATMSTGAWLVPAAHWLAGPGRLVIVLLALVVVATALNPRFLSSINLFNVLRQVSVIGIISVGMTYVILAGGGGIDLSVGSAATLCGTLAAGLQVFNNLPTPLAWAIAILAGVAVGSGNGFMATRLGFQPFIATLAMMVALDGIAMTYSGGAAIPGISRSFQYLGTAYWGPVPFPVIIFLAFIITGGMVLRYTLFGHYLYATGSNAAAAWLAGVNISRVRMCCYVFSGVCSAVGGLMLTSVLAGSVPYLARGYELDAIAAVTIGGTSLAGGVGGVGGTFLGVLILGILNNMFNLIGLSAYAQMIAKGIIIVVAVASQRRG